MSEFSGKCIWLTGASSGIGEAVARELGRRGAKLVITARREEILRKLADEIVAAGGKAHVVAADVSDREAVQQAARAAEAWGGPVDLLISNAGTHVPTEPLKFNSEEYIELMRTNYFGMLYTIEAVLPGMLERGAGRVAAVSSLAASRGLPMSAAYGASKAAMTNFLESIRFHVRRKGVGVTIIHPGFVKTPLTDKNTFFMPFMIDAPKAARIICDGLERKKNEISFPFPFNWLVKLGRLIPYPVYEAAVDRMW